MIEDSEFFVTLQSNQTVHNSCLSFNVTLPHTVHLYSDWKVALTKISTTVEFDQTLTFLPTFVITANVVEESILNNEVLRSLRVITLNQHWQDTGCFIDNCESREYHRIHTKNFFELLIEFVDVNPIPLSAKDGVTFVTLHFIRA